MGKVKTGEKAIDFTFNTDNKTGLKLSDVVKNADKTIVHFLRYYGCRICQLDIRDYVKLYDQIKAKNAQLFIVLQSKPQTIKNAATEVAFPFDIICDPDQELYKLYDIGSMTESTVMDKEKMAAASARIQASGLVHGEYEGNEQQLPAIFILDKDMNVLYDKYSDNLTDLPSPAEVVETLI